MPSFRCAKCGCIENTALSNFWHGVALCSECDPEIGKWHGRFEKHSADGLLLGEDGFLYSPLESLLPSHTKIVGVVGRMEETKRWNLSTWLGGSP